MNSIAENDLTISALRVRSVNVPIDPPLQSAAGVLAWAPLVLVDLETNRGVVGSSYVFAYTTMALAPLARLIANIEVLIRGQHVAPASLSNMLASRFRLLGNQGLVAMALSAIDMAAWDAQARAVQQPLYRLLGASSRDTVKAYASLRSFVRDEVVSEAVAARAQGFGAIKLKFGHEPIAAEVETLKALRSAVGTGLTIMVDYNQSLTIADGLNRARILDEHDIGWIEEPVRADDYAGHARIAAAAATPIQIGENCWGPNDASKAITASACDFLMPDVMKIGGVTGWVQTAALSAAAGIPVSSHIFIEYSAHLLAATPGRHFLEWLDLAAPIRRTGKPLLTDGVVVPTDGPGVGIVWDDEAIEKYAAT